MIAACAALDLSLQSCGVFSASGDCAEKATCAPTGDSDGAENGGNVGPDGTVDGESDRVSQDTSTDTNDGAGPDGTGNGESDRASADTATDTSIEAAAGDGDTGTGDSEAMSPIPDGSTDEASAPTLTDGGGADGTIASACGLPSPLPNNGLIYNGGTPSPTCPQTPNALSYPNNFWFSYDDATSDGATFVHTADFGGCEGPTDCAFHAMGSGYTGYGAGVGLTLNSNAIFDASGYSGLQVWLKGTTSGTRGLGYARKNDSVHVKFLTGSPDGSTADPRNGDDYGAYCPTTDADGGVGNWVVCTLAFTTLTRDGFRGVDSGAPDPATDTFDPKDLLKIEFEFSSYVPPDGGTPGPVSFDVWIDDIAFF